MQVLVKIIVFKEDSRRLALVLLVANIGGLDLVPLHHTYRATGTVEPPLTTRTIREATRSERKKAHPGTPVSPNPTDIGHQLAPLLRNENDFSLKSPWGIPEGNLGRFEDSKDIKDS
ncbi:hypothetical protein CPC08DRAFT_770867 [Agrocybe pediades]|nr:hypothetical protein CPC08DRAFT_770867 [Agrocybe pediades]